MTSKIRLGILDCDELADELQEEYICYATMFRKLLWRGHDKIEFVTYKVLQHQLPKTPEECDAYLITGSKTGVYDDEDWLPLLGEFIRLAYASGVKLIGLCFGHQMLAHWLGGQAEKSESGWGIGALVQEKCESSKDVAWMKDMPDELCLLYSHQDQVIKLPEGAQRLYGSHFCPNGAYSIPGRVLSFQGHPEFTREYSRSLMTLRQSRYAPGQYLQAIETLEREPDNDLVADWIIRFVEGALSS